MKKYILLLIFATCSTLLSAQSSSDEYKYQMIDYINKGYFKQATNIIEKVEDWTFFPNDEKAWLKVEEAQDFAFYLDSIEFYKPLIDSVLSYIEDEYYVMFDYYQQSNDYTTAINILEMIVSIQRTLYSEQHPAYATSLHNLGALYVSIGDYSKAEPYFWEALRIRKSVLGEQHPDYAASLDLLAMLYHIIEDYNKAEYYYLKALEIYNSIGEQHSEYAECLYKLGNLYYAMRDYSQAEAYCLEALEIQKSVLGEQHPDYAMSLNSLGGLYADMGDYSKAETYYLEALEIRKSVLGEQHPDYAMSLNNLGALYARMGDYSKAEAYHLEALEIQKSVLGEPHPDYAMSLNSLGNLYADMGDYSKAEAYYLKALEIQKSVLGEQNPNYAMSLRNLGGLYEDMGNYSKAETYYLEALEITKSVLGEQHLDYAKSLNKLGGLYRDMGDYSKAESYYLDALRIRKSVLGEQHPDYAASLYNLGCLYDDMGDYMKAEPYCFDALRIRKSVLGEQHLDYAMSLNGLGCLYYNMGDYVKAEPYYLNALAIIKSVLGEQHLDYAMSLDNLGSLYGDMGDYSKAESYYLDALRIRKSVLGEQHPDYAKSLHNLGGLYYNMGDYSKAETYNLAALKIIKSVLGEQHLDYAASLNNLGSIYAEIGDYSKAEIYYLKALQIKKLVLGEQHPDYAMSLYNLGSLYAEIGDYSKAETYDLAALKIIKSVLGEQHPYYAMFLHNLGGLYEDMGNYSKAETYYTHSILIKKNSFIQSSDFMSEQQRNKFWGTIRYSFYNTYPSFAFQYSREKPSISTFAYDNELFTKGLLLFSTNEVYSSILHSNDTTLIRQWNELTTKKQQIQTLSESAPQSPYLAELQEQAELLEKELTKKSAAFRQSRSPWSITWDSVRTHLEDDQVAIEYFSARLNEDSTMYCALLLRNNSEYPDLIPLFEEKQALSLIHTATESQNNCTYEYKIEEGDTIGNGAQLANIAWSKIMPYIHEGETIYFAPSGLLHQLTIEALPYDETRTMADVFNLVRLSSTRELVLNRQNTAHTTATLYGGIQYNMSGDELLAESEQYTTTNLPASRGIENDTLNRGSVDYLPGSKTEVEHINQMLQQNNLQVQLFTSTTANEESFKALSGTKKNILHIATHGFFWSDSTAHKKEFFTQRMLQPFDHDRPTHPVIDPLNRCGLLLAGANTALSGHSKDLPDGVQDGILTAKEISLLDLREADLVVLSACETGNGEITGDGVFGLQRAFKQAGAQTIIMSLWPVNDVATQLLMTEFYRNWITLHQSKREAFRNAQNTVRSQYPEPAYWAGFIMLD